MNKRFLHAITMLIGMIIGVGIFGVPYAIEKVGFILGFFYILIIGLILLLVNLLYSEIVLRTEGKHRLVGYAAIYLGKQGRKITSLAQILAFYGALIAYIIVGGQFLQIILLPIFGGSLLTYQTIFFICVSLAVLIGLRLVALVEFFMTLLLLVVVAIIFFAGLPYVWYPNLYVMNLKNIFFPYGVTLFALGGAAAIPAMRELLRGQEKKFKKAITIGTIIPVVITILFTFVVIGVSGEHTTPEAINGLAGPLGQIVIFLGAIFGFLAIATSFLVLGLNLRDIFNLDYQFGRILSWLLACVVPFLIFLWSRPTFIGVISFTGAVLGGLEGILITLIWLKARKIGQRVPEYSLRISNFIICLLIMIFVLGIIYKLIYGE